MLPQPGTGTPRAPLDAKQWLLVGAVFAVFALIAIVASNVVSRWQDDRAYLARMHNPCEQDSSNSSTIGCTPTWDADDDQLVSEARQLCDIARSTPQDDPDEPMPDSHRAAGGTQGGWSAGIKTANWIAISGNQSIHLRSLHPDYTDDQIAYQVSAVRCD